MKRVYEAPAVSLEQFAANEYIAACGDSGTVYKFVCDAGNGVYGSVYQETNGRDGLQTGRGGDERLARYRVTLLGNERGYHACGIPHEADTDDDFLEGYYLPRGNINNVVDVIIWRGSSGNNVHCTTNLDKSTWETAKS